MSYSDGTDSARSVTQIPLWFTRNVVCGRCLLSFTALYPTLFDTVDSDKLVYCTLE